MEAIKIYRGRFKDQNLISSHFSESVLVKCPSCQNRAEVKTNKKTFQTVFHCPTCCHHYATNNTVLDMSLKVYCNSCAHRISIHMPNVTSKKQAILVRCPDCGDTQSYQPTYTQHLRLLRTAQATDPFLGLELWYNAPYKDHTLWAYNYQHLEYLEQYIEAKLRERNNRRYTTMVEKLPQFIKSAKNREALLKVIQKLKHK
ncbi:hypothetical protein Q0590_33730 [Rhodocytophaga aerolata]|uniref:Replication restart DNA helicase PriA n=1 Tax=Rhodocytophaga aerolata TaxID=455078 RepID=A0ABT8RIU1_9BACT|nr:hypothetical protein [Rhodocytophaga aerolata]MDO1451284.1 hypothetical protein [Rhodocytophaga aerolata]